ncbi:Aspartic proteinase nepenthesin-2 [Dichanthelium oligosanthes]|uniref:Aspartic proteinase nepenthesin-2 n=1 Tax=Dichanthelium oligosanthes TaxID=888268 RepID=A0A1E5VQ10_9POAL|nr:Aspartic proteinase nepenthesin-2 [Dichanthelium oligosanthes]
MTPRTKQQLKQFFKNHASDMADLLPGDQGQGGGSYNDQNEPGVGSSNGQGKPGHGSNDGQSQAPATNAGMYFYSYSVGTPAQSVSGALDISSELVWTQCSCTTCDVTTLATLFYPTLSTTMAELPCTSSTCQDFVTQTCSASISDPECTYTYMYRGGVANTTGYLATEAFTFGATVVDDVVFGCGLDNVGDFGGASGVIGLGRGPLSLVSQLQAERFSYYFAPDDSVGTESFIHFGDDATPKTSHVLSTPLLASSDYPNAYLVGLSGIQVDGKDLGIPQGTFDLRKNGSGGVVLSITIPVTFLEERAYKLLRQALVSGIRLPTVNSAALGLDLCYTSQSLATAKIPAIALVFDGNAVMELEVGNYFYMDASSGLECLTIMPSSAGGVSLLGSLVQAGTHMIYDLHGSKLAFESLEQLSPPSNSSQIASRQRSSSAPPPQILPAVMLVAHFLWVVVYMVL